MDKTLKIDRHAVNNEKMFLQRTFSQFFNKQKNIKSRKFRKDGKPKGFPHFKSKKNPIQSYTNMHIKDRQYSIIDYKNHLINISVIGLTPFNKREKPIPDHWHQCQITISRRHGKYYASIIFEYEDDRPGIKGLRFDENPKLDLNVLGLDYSSKSLYVDSNGLSANYPKFYLKSQKRLRMLNKKLSRQQKGSKNREKTCKKISKLHEHIANQRKDFLHKLSTSITKMYDVICVESINMQAISQCLKLGKSTLDNSFGMFRQMLQYKQDRQPYHLLMCIDRFYPSSKTCSKCGFVKTELKLDERIYKCPQCGSIIDRDENAAINLREEGLRMLNQYRVPQYHFRNIAE